MLKPILVHELLGPIPTASELSLRFLGRQRFLRQHPRFLFGLRHGRTGRGNSVGRNNCRNPRKAARTPKQTTVKLSSTHKPPWIRRCCLKKELNYTSLRRVREILELISHVDHE